jgi:hypothetical protein
MSNPVQNLFNAVNQVHAGMGSAVQACNCLQEAAREIGDSDIEEYMGQFAKKFGSAHAFWSRLGDEFVSASDILDTCVRACNEAKILQVLNDVELDEQTRLLIAERLEELLWNI